MAAIAHQRGDQYFHNQELAYGLAGAVNLAFMFVAGLLLKILQRTPFFDWRFKTIGLWIETVQHQVGVQYTLSMITYEWASEEFKIVGHTFSGERFDVFSSWRSMTLRA